MIPAIPSEVVTHMRSAERVVALTGAGVSAESGIPTFRQAQTGLWAQYDPIELATPQAFLRTPRLVWDWYTYRRQIIAVAEPNPAHYALVDLEQHYPTFTLVTQNIDGLHWRAGSRDMLELHGNIERTRCFECGTYAQGWDEEGELPPRCGHCGGLLRPDVVWFGEGLPERELHLAYTVTQQVQIFLSIGTSAVVQPAASLPLIAKRAGAYVIEINPEETSLSVVADCWLQGQAGVILPELVRQVFNLSENQEE